MHRRRRSIWTEPEHPVAAAAYWVAWCLVVAAIVISLAMLGLSLGSVQGQS